MADTSPVRRLNPRHLMWGIAAGVLVSALIALAVFVALFRQTIPVLTPNTLAAAQQRWHQHGPTSYDLQIVLGGSQSGDIRIEVRDGEVIRMTRDGRVPQQRRTWDYWSVPNQFDMMQQDLDSAQAPQKAFGVTSPDQVMLRAEFDEQFGYPRVYRRTVSGAQYDIEWRIESFVPVD